MKISRKLYTEISEAVEAIEVTEDLSWRDDYSGRYMYGKNCVGVVTDKPMKVCMALAVVLEEMHNDEFRDLKELSEIPLWYHLNPLTDSMGLRTIVYFPNLQVAD